MEISLSLMEVITRLSTRIELPTTTFVNVFISKCIQGMDKIQDKRLQTRQVRLVCMLLGTFLKNGVISLTDFSTIEIEAFCIQFSRVKEASSLFRAIKMKS